MTYKLLSTFHNMEFTRYIFYFLKIKLIHYSIFWYHSFKKELYQSTNALKEKGVKDVLSAANTHSSIRKNMAATL